MKATDLLKLFAEFGRTSGRAVKKRETLAGRIVDQLTIHALLEEEIFYAALRGVEGAGDLVAEAQREHEEVKQLLGEIQGMEMSGDEIAERIKELRDMVQHHVSEEESEMFARARELGDEKLKRLGQDMQERKKELQKTGKQHMRRAA